MKTLICILTLLILLMASTAVANPFLAADIDPRTKWVTVTVNGEDKGSYETSGTLVMIDLDPLNLPDGELVFKMKACYEWGCSSDSDPLSVIKAPLVAPAKLKLSK